MHQAPASLWNEIEKATKLKTEWGQKMFRLNEQELDDALETQAEQMKADGHQNKVILAYQLLLPLCLERSALAEYQRKTEQSDLSGVLPEVSTVAEAVNLAANEFDLREEQLADLAELLRPLMPA